MWVQHVTHTFNEVFTKGIPLVCLFIPRISALHVTQYSCNKHCSFDALVHVLLMCRYGALSTDFPIVLDDVDCSSSTYLTILQCRYSTFIDSNCDRGVDDVSVICCKYYIMS